MEAQATCDRGRLAVGEVSHELRTVTIGISATVGAYIVVDKLTSKHPSTCFVCEVGVEDVSITSLIVIFVGTTSEQGKSFTEDDRASNFEAVTIPQSTASKCTRTDKVARCVVLQEIPKKLLSVS